jgi:putative transcriptional regulator
MPQILLRRALGAIAALVMTLVLPALLLGAAAPTATEPQPAPGHPSLADQLLIAPPSMRDPRFDHAVILVVRHDRSGALGIIINMPAGERPLAEMMAAIGEAGTPPGTLTVYAGGPVQPELALVVHTAEYHLQGTLDIDGRIAMTMDAQILRDIAARKGPQKMLFAFGYAGWGGGQLENEMDHNVWFTAPEDPQLVFDAARDKVWDLAMARRTKDL